MIRVGRFVVRRGGLETPVDHIEWEHGVQNVGVTGSTDVQGLVANIAWAETQTTTGTRPSPYEPRWNAANGTRVEVDWVEEGQDPIRVLTGTIDTSNGRSLADPVSRIKDGTARLNRHLDIRPVAFTMPAHPELSGYGGLRRRVQLQGTWVTHQAMTTAGFDPGPWMHHSAVWFQNMCGSAWPVADRRHAFRTLGDLRQAYRLSDNGLPPGGRQGDTQPCMEDVFFFGVTNPRPSHVTTNYWQLTMDMGTCTPDPSHTGELLLRNLDTAAGVAFTWTPDVVRVSRRDTNGTYTLLATYPRTDGASEAFDCRWSLAIHPTDGTIRVITDNGHLATITGSGVTLPTGPNSRCTIRGKSVGVIGPVMVTRSNSVTIVTQESSGRIYRSDSTGRSLPGFDYVPPLPAGQVLADQADAERGMSGQPIWQWIDADEHLINSDYAYLAAQPIQHLVSNKPTPGQIQLDEILWATEGDVLAPSVQVVSRRAHPIIRGSADVPLAGGPRDTAAHGETLEAWLHPDPDEAWLDVDLYPLLAGNPYPPPESEYLNRMRKSWVGGEVTTPGEGDDPDTTTWLNTSHITEWSLRADGTVAGAMEMLDPRTVLVTGTFMGGAARSASTMPYQNSEGLREDRKSQPFPQLRGMGKLVFNDHTIEVIVPGVDDRHPPIRHDAGMWAQSNTYCNQIASNIASEVVNPTPRFTVLIELAPQVRPGHKMRVIEHRPTGHVVETTGVVQRVRGSSDSGQMEVALICTTRTVSREGAGPATTHEWGINTVAVDEAPEKSTTPVPPAGTVDSTPED